MKKVQAVIGAQYGDEGKGKIVDYLSSDVSIAVRFNGSGNAGHCVEEDDGTRHKVHILPASTFRNNVLCCTGAGMIINPETLLQEIDRLGPEFPQHRIFIDPKAHVTTVYHIYQDAKSEKELGEDKIGTTLTGNGPAYADKMLRKGLRLSDLVGGGIHIKALLLKSAFYDENACDLEKEVRSLCWYGKRLSKYFIDVGLAINQAIDEGVSVLFAGAHGTFLDIDHGDYPYVTSSTCMIGGIGSTGVSPRHINEVIGVVKSYTTRSGAGPIYSMPEILADQIRVRGKEIGTTTGRNRRIGWIDLDMVKKASIMNSFSYIAVTMLDVLSGLDTIEMIHQRKKFSVAGWYQDISNVRKFEDLPMETIRYIQEIEKAAGVQALLISVGPKRNQIIDRR